MKKFFMTAVAVAIAALCTVCTSCSSYDSDMDDVIKKPSSQFVTEKSCEVTRNIYDATGLITRAASDYTGTPDGEFTVTSYHKKVLVYEDKDIIRSYTGTNYVKAYDVKRPRYAKSANIFNNPTMSQIYLEDGRVSNIVTFQDGNTHDFDFALVEETHYDTDTVMVAGQSFQKCLNEWVDRQLIDSQVSPLGRDSLDWTAYSVRLTFMYKLAEGPDNAGVFYVTIPTLWVAKSGTNPEIPEDQHDIVSFKDGDKGFDTVNDTISNSWQDIIPVQSDGRDGNPFRVQVILKNKLIAPEYQIKTVPDLSWTAGNATASPAVKNGELIERENNIFVQPYVQVYTTRTSKCDAIFNGEYEGNAYFVDSLGKAHMFITKDWSFKDNGWEESKLEPTDNFERKLLTSNITGIFNENQHSRKGEVELQALKGEGVKIVSFEYKDFGIRSVKPNEQYFTYATQYAVLSNGNTEKLGEIGTNLYVSVTSPEKQIITVQDWAINDINAATYNATRTGTREDKQTSGTFTIQKYDRIYTTKTNKSDHKFVSHYEDKVVFTDSLGKEISFKGLELAFADNGGVRTLTDLSEQDDFERKAMTSTITVTVNNTDKADYSAEVEFRKAVDKEELIDWSVTSQDLKPIGNGLWTSTTTISYVWKLAGTKTETISQNLDWSIVGEAKSQVILTSATADYNTLNAGSETSSTSANGNITVVTKVKKYSEDYTTLTDNYTATMQTASYKAVVEGKTISFNFLAPSGMTVAHKDGSLTDGNRTTTVSGTTYNVYDHTGSVTATVTSSVGNQTQDATDVKEVLVKKVVEPYNPAWGNVVGFGAATLTYHPNVGSSGQGAFHITLVINFENGKLVTTTASYGNPNAVDFTFDENDFYYYGDKITASAKINSAALFNGRWIPALLSMDGTGWKYVTIYDQIVNMSQQLAETCGIKNFQGNSTAKVTPFLSYTGKVSPDKVLTVYNEQGVPVFNIR